jgi:tyrosyl-tRNA synthetase
LAHEVTRLIHGEEATKNAETATGLLTGSVPVDQADDTSLQILRSEQPSLNVQSDSSIIDALVKSGLASSNTEARRLLQDNAISVNGQKVNRENFEASDFRNDRLLLRKGKKFKDTALVEL